MNGLRVKWFCESRSMASCGMVRGVLPASQLNYTRNISVDVKGSNEILISDFPGVDIIVLQRLIGEHAIDICRRARGDKTRVVFDIDDALWLLPDTNSGEEYAKYQIFFPKEAQANLIQLMVSEVDVVTCSTEELAEEIRKLGALNVRVIENRVDQQFFTLPKTNINKATIDLVWYAALGHSANSVLLDEICSRIFAQFPNVRLHLIGAPSTFPPLKQLMRFGNKVVLHDWVGYVGLGTKIKEFDIALCPVHDYPFTRSKSELKAIETSMAGLIPVLSNMPQYRRFSDRIFNEQEKQLLVENTVDAWVDILQKLISKELVIDTPSLAQRTINKYSIAGAISDWGNFYHSIV